MNPTLLHKLKSINPTEGEWIYEPNGEIKLMTDKGLVYGENDDYLLIPLAPAMRKALLEMEEEREARNKYYEDKIEVLNRIITEKERELEIAYGQIRQLTNHTNP